MEKGAVGRRKGCIKGMQSEPVRGSGGGGVCVGGEGLWGYLPRASRYNYHAEWLGHHLRQQRPTSFSPMILMPGIGVVLQCRLCHSLQLA